MGPKGLTTFGGLSRFCDWDKARRAQDDLRAKLEEVWTSLNEEYAAFQKEVAENLSVLDQGLEQQKEGQKILKIDLEKLGE